MSYYDALPCCGSFSRQPIQGSQTPYYTLSQMPSSPTMMQMPALPTGFPTGPATGPMPGMAASPPAVTTGIGGPVTSQTLESTQYIPGYLKTQIGKRVRVEFLIGTNGPLVDRSGTLLGVGASYILINPENTDDVLLCDLYSIKFVTFFR